jgi:sec-independent protein translocase protein TatB
MGGIMLDVGMGEFLVIAVIAVIILGPDRLPKAIADVTRWIRMLRDQAAGARRDIAAAADLDPNFTDEIKQSMKDLSELHPRRLASSILSDAEPAPAIKPQSAKSPSDSVIFDSDAT